MYDWGISRTTSLQEIDINLIMLLVATYLISIQMLFWIKEITDFLLVEN